MHGLTISFEIKRQRKINQVMNYFLVLALAIFAFTGLIYIPYLQKLSELNTAKEKLSLTTNGYQQVQSENTKYQSSKKYEIIYSDDFEKLDAAKTNYSKQLLDVKTILSQAEFKDSISLVSIQFNDNNEYEKEKFGLTIKMIFQIDENLSVSEIRTKKFQLIQEILKTWEGSNRIDDGSDGLDSTPVLEMTMYYGTK